MKGLGTSLERFQSNERECHGTEVWFKDNVQDKGREMIMNVALFLSVSQIGFWPCPP